MTYYAWGDGAENDLRDGLLVLLTSVIKDEILAQEKKAEQINLVTIHIYKQGMSSKSEGYYEDPRGEYVVEIATEDIISATFDYYRDTIEDASLSSSSLTN